MEPVLHLDVPTKQGPQLHLQVSGKQESVQVWTSQHNKGLSFTWACLHYKSLGCTWVCQQNRDLGLTLTCLGSRSLCWSGHVWTVSLLHLDMSTLRGLFCTWTKQGPKLNLDVSGHIRSLCWSGHVHMHHRGLSCTLTVYTTDAFTAPGQNRGLRCTYTWF